MFLKHNHPHWFFAQSPSPTQQTQWKRKARNQILYKTYHPWQISALPIQT